MWGDDMSKDNMVKSTGKIFMILEELAKKGRPTKLGDISKALKLPPSTTHRLLSTLIELGYVEQREKSSGYNLTFKILNLASATFNSLDLGKLSYSHLVNLRDNTGETANIIVINGNETMYVQRVETNEIVRVFSSVGRRAPLHATASGKILLSGLSDEKIERMVAEAGLTKYTEKTITDFSSLMDEVNLVKERGYSIEDEEYENDVFCIAAPIRDYTGAIVASISISLPTCRSNDRDVHDLAKHVVFESTEVSSKLGYIREE